MIKLDLYSSKGIKKGTVSLPRSLEAKENLVLLAQAIRVYEAGRHPGLSKTKSRGEISASKRKIYRQKGTGRARHGAKSAPIFVGGGVAHGPSGVKRKLHLPKKMRRRALKVALTLKSKDGQLIVLEGTSKLKKTRDAAALLDKITQKEKNAKQNGRFTFALSDESKDAILALRNIENVVVTKFSNLNAYQVYFGGTIVIGKEALKESSKSINAPAAHTRKLFGRESKSVKSTKKSA
ncbi:50S ribosomal protein L4 [Patescibacteria group bacterium]|nr:50S ribosomal protein L4 [Patescibacteria group bacterium]